MRPMSVNSANVTGLVKTIRAISEQNNNYPTVISVQFTVRQFSACKGLVRIYRHVMCTFPVKLSGAKPY